MFDQESYHDFVLNYRNGDSEDVIGFYPEETKLPSGRMSFWYWKGGLLLNQKDTMDRLAKFVLEFCEDNEIMHKRELEKVA